LQASGDCDLNSIVVEHAVVLDDISLSLEGGNEYGGATASDLPEGDFMC
jgi:hypothetical protein